MILSQRDIDGLLFCGEHYGAPADLLASALRVQPAVLDQDHRTVEAGRIRGYRAAGPGPEVVLADQGRYGRDRAGVLPDRPALGRFAHIRAVLAARLWLASGPAWQTARPGGTPSGGCGPAPGAARRAHVPDAEVHWPGIAGSPYAGQVWAHEVELTPKPVGRTTEIMTGLLASSGTPRWCT